MMSWGDYICNLFGGSDCVRYRVPETSRWQVVNVWITSLDFMLDSLEKKGKNAEQLDTCSAQSTAKFRMCHSIYRISWGIEVD
jgi:hypothetical protein